MATAPIARLYTAAEYLALERRAPSRSEFFRGFITAMAGASRDHNRIAGNFYRKVGDQLEGRPCEAFISDMRVRTGPDGLYTYPDISVACGELNFEDDEGDTLLNPTMIAEVLSPSTEAYDRGQKFEHYKAIDSLREYVLIAQDEVRVERFIRQDDEWIRIQPLCDIDETLTLQSIGCAIPLREIYARVLPREDAGSERK